MAVPLQSHRHWVYVDDRRTHEVHAQVAPRDAALVLATTEFPAGSRDPAEVVHAETPVRGEADLRLMLRELEARLALMGRYFRASADDMRWEPLPPPPAARPDLRAHEVPLPEGKPGHSLRFHHFHAGPASRDRLLIAMPRQELDDRHVLAEMQFDFPLVERGDMRVLHTRLTSATLASSVVREHVEAPRRGYRKLVEPTDYQRAYGDGWLEKAKGMLHRAVARVVAIETERPAAPARPLTQLERLHGALADARITGLAARHLDPATQRRLVREGEHAIRRHIAALRRKEGHRVAYELSIVEAALLVAWALPSQMWDLVNEEGPKLLHFLHGYD